MIRKTTSNKCPLCSGYKTNGKTTFTADFGTGVIVIRNVPATVCSQCGADWIKDEIASKIEEIIGDAEKKRMEVEVTSF